MGGEGNYKCYDTKSVLNLNQFQLKKTLFVLLLAFSLKGFSQSRIGIPIDRVRAEYANPQYKLKSAVYDSLTYLVLQDKHATVIHRFGKDSLCNKTYVTPEDTTIANQMASTYDAIYQPLSSLEWLVRLPHEILDIELVQTINKEGTKLPTFQWTRSKIVPHQ
jgi:hypothetical protein